MRSIIVTAADDSSAVFVRPDAIVYTRAAPGGKTMIRFAGGDSLVVNEPPEEIEEQLPDPMNRAGSPALTEDGIPADSPVADAIAKSRASAAAKAKAGKSK